MLRFQDFDSAYLKLLSFFGLIPDSFLATEKLIISKKYKLYIFFLISLLGAVTIYSEVIKMTRESSSDSIARFLTVLSNLAEISLVWVSGCSIIFLDSKKWVEINNNLRYITDMQCTFRCDSKRIESDDSCYFFSLLILVNAINLAQFVTLFFGGGFEVNKLTDTLLQVINNNQVFFLLHLIYKIKYAFQSMNEYYVIHIRKPATNLIQFQTGSGVGVAGNNKSFKVIKNMFLIRNFQKHYKKIDLCVSNFNAIYGWLTLIAILKCFLTILLSLAYVIDAVRAQNPSEGFDWAYFVPVFFLTLVCTIIFILTCDKVTTASQAVPLVCSRLQDTFPMVSKERQELANFSLYTRSNSVCISAAGFFDIGKNTLLALISTVTTYFIVIIQFKDL